MSKFKTVLSQVDFAKLEEDIIDFWKENKIFEKSLEKDSPNGDWTFLDGPPFITGLPHYGSLLSSIPKDLFPRYWTMKGYRVRRVWGWDCHGLPAENKVEENLGIKRKKDIEEKIGVKKFIDECKFYVNNVSSEWEWYVDHIGRWVDFKNAYRTMDLPYMETVMWVFKQMYDKNLIYKGLRVSLYCPHCATPISNFEVAMDAENYRAETEDTAVYKYPLKGEKDTFILAWSTTPWNKLVTPALAVNPNLTYVKVEQAGEKYILAKTTLKMLKDGYKILEEFKGKKLIGKEFIPHYDFFKIDSGKKAFIVIGGDFVTAEEGTGVVTIAAYGEEDLAIMQKENIQIVTHLDEEGIIKDSVPMFGGIYYLDANKLVLDDLNKRGLLYRVDKYSHDVPHCWRCGTRLYYGPQDAWYVNVQILKEEMKKTNEAVSWFPKHFKHGRFLKSLEAAPDWCISRSRYWGSPVPVWECGECGERFVPGSIRELEERSGKKIIDLHKPEIDEVTVKCAKCGKTAKRVAEVLDSWTEAGSASFAERHFPFNQEVKLEEFFPPDFIVEYTGQIRAWFYVLHVIANALYQSHAYKNVLVTGVVLGTDGRKMSKNYNNYPDPKGLLEKYGGDALRLYLMGAPVMKGEDINFNEEGVAEEYRFLLIFWNTYKFFVEYANLSGWTPNEPKEQLTTLDKWILSRLNEVNYGIKKAYENYNTNEISKILKDFIINDFSTWYIRRSRDRVGPKADILDRNTALLVMYEVLVNLTKLAAPLIPFITEEIFKNLAQQDSVHLQSFPKEDKDLVDEQLIRDMKIVRKIAEAGHAKRKEANIKLRQPLASLSYQWKDRLSKDLEQLLAEELNVKAIEYKKSTSKDPKVVLDTKITPKLKEEGEVRELIRQIQQLRKEQNLTMADKTKVVAPKWPKNFEKQIIEQTASVSISKGPKLGITKVG
ncbi:isoleucine--tRNA ligase [Candidatus Daviesbacteria bacterium]|nr:isoleucine--tRNA ligase [Candidatus Daviesbacteria bacterium]